VSHPPPPLGSPTHTNGFGPSMGAVLGRPTGGGWAKPSRTAAAPATAKSALAVQPTGCELLVAGLSLVSLVSLFLPWYMVQWSDPVGDSGHLDVTSALGSAAGGWRFVCLVLAAAVLVSLSVRLLRPDLYARLPVPYRAVLATLAVATVATLAIAFFALPYGGTQASAYGVAIGVTQDWAAYVGLAASVLAATAAIVNSPKEPAPKVDRGANPR
jgi:hypothetical protein